MNTLARWKYKVITLLFMSKLIKNPHKYWFLLAYLVNYFGLMFFQCGWKPFLPVKKKKNFMTNHRLEKGRLKEEVCVKLGWDWSGATVRWARLSQSTTTINSNSPKQLTVTQTCPFFPQELSAFAFLHSTANNYWWKEGMCRISKKKGNWSLVVKNSFYIPPLKLGHFSVPTYSSNLKNWSWRHFHIGFTSSGGHFLLCYIQKPSSMKVFT